MQRLEVSGAARPIYGSLGVKRLIEGFMGNGNLQRANPGLYPGLVPVENLSWMSFSGEDGVRTQVKTWRKDC